jgi:hypothetical protein
LFEELVTKNTKATHKPEGSLQPHQAKNNTVEHQLQVIRAKNDAAAAVISTSLIDRTLDVDADKQRLSLLTAAAVAVKLALQHPTPLTVVPTADEVLVSMGHVFPGQIDAARARREVWGALEPVLAALRRQGVPIFLRAGTWLAAIRNRGYTPFDYDNDFAILDTHEDKLRRAKLPKPFTFKITAGKPGKFQVIPFVAGWPLMDGVMYETHAKNDTVVDISRPERFTFAFDDVLNLVDLPFYDGIIPGIRNASGYLTTRYGEDCLTVQLNKCAKWLGELFLEDADKCKWPLYKGGVDYPYMTRAPYIVAGSL